MWKKAAVTKNHQKVEKKGGGSKSKVEVTQNIIKKVEKSDDKDSMVMTGHHK